MKKILMAILVVVMSVSCVFAITGCKQEEAVKVTITYDADGGNISSTTQEVDVDNFTLLIPEKAGYTFKGWSKDGEAFTNDSKLVGDVTLKALWEINKFNVTFEVGTRGTISTSKTLELNAVGYSFPQVTCKAGATFKGWTLNGQAFNTTTVLTSDITVVADYEVTGYTVTYNYVGKLMRDGVEVALEDNSELLPVTEYELPVVVRNGYDFGGWKIQGTDTIVTDAALADDYNLVAVQTKSKYDVIYFKSYEKYLGYLTNGTLVADDYDAIEDVEFGGAFEHVNAVVVPGKTHVSWKGIYVEGNVNYNIDDFEEGYYPYEGNVYVYPVYENDLFVVKYESGATADFVEGDYVEVEYSVLDVANATLSASPIHEDGKEFIKWVYNNGTIEGSDDVDVEDDTDFRAVIANAQKGDTFVLTAVFDENDYVIYRFGTTILNRVVSATAVTYDVNDIDVSAYAQAGYHIEWFVGDNAFEEFSFATEDDIATVVIDAKLIANEAKLVVKVWGPENDTAIGLVNNAYSYEVDVATGDTLDVTIAGKNGYVFLYYTTTAWTTTTSGAPENNVEFLNNSNVITVAEDGATLTIYAYFYNTIV